jgi:hypothetical protein
MGVSLANQFKSMIENGNSKIFDTMVLVSPEATQSEFKDEGKVRVFDGFMNEEEDRNRLIAFLKDEDMAI